MMEMKPHNKTKRMRISKLTSIQFILWRMMRVSILISLVTFQLAAQLPAVQLENYPLPIREQITRAQQAAQAQPRDAATVGKLGMVLQAYNEHAAAAECFARAQTLAPNEFRWKYYAAVSQLALGNQTQALESLRQAIKRKQDYWPAKIQWADLLFTLNQTREAETLYSEVTKNNASSQWAWYGLGRVQAAQKDFPAAINSFARALNLSPQFGMAHYAKAMALREVGQLEKAREHLALYQQFKSVRPNRNDALLDEIQALNLSAQEFLNQGLALEEQGDLPASILAHEKALAVNPSFLQAHINLIQLHGRLAQPEQAAKAYRSALQINPNAAEAHYNFGVVLLAEKKFAEAKNAFTQALASNPNHTEAAFNVGVVLLQETKLEEAAQSFRAALAGQPNFRPAHFELGRILVHRGKLDEAIAHFQQTLAPEDQDTPRYLYALAATYLRAGKRTEGVSLLQGARQRAAIWGQQELLASIDRDLKTLEEK